MVLLCVTLAELVKVSKVRHASKYLFLMNTVRLRGLLDEKYDCYRMFVSAYPLRGHIPPPFGELGFSLSSCINF